MYSVYDYTNNNNITVGSIVWSIVLASNWLSPWSYGYIVQLA